MDQTTDFSEQLSKFIPNNIRFRNNPKFNHLVQHIDGLSERAVKAQVELKRMVEMSAGLQLQIEMQVNI
jgi:hypothetical protein